MNPAGILLVVIGAWVATQVLAGNALERLNIVKGGTPGAVQAPGAVPNPTGTTQGTGNSNDPGGTASQKQGTKR